MPAVFILFGGPAGAGKSSLASAWCASRDKAAHIELDAIRQHIVSGLADPQDGGATQSEQYDLSVRACCAAGRVFWQAGYDVAIDDVLQRDAFVRVWQPALVGLPAKVVILRPTLEETLRRATNRSKRVREDIILTQHAAMEAWPADVCLDTTGLSVEDSLALGRERGLLP